MKPKLLLLLCVAAMVFGVKANAIGTNNKSTHKADILGGVYNHDSKKPLSSVTVTVYSADKKEKVVITDDAGLYAFDDLKAGTYKFVFEKNGYKSVTREKVVVQPDAGVQLNIEMSQHALFEFIPGPFHFTDLE
jgi:Carboxypeptidase regulatory-like domain